MWLKTEQVAFKCCLSIRDEIWGRKGEKAKSKISKIFSKRSTVQSAENRRKMSPILVTLTSRSDSNFERSNISFKENKRDGVDPNSDGLDCCVQKNKKKSTDSAD